MKVVLAADHAGYELKQKLVFFVRGLGYDVEDLGATRYDELDDYPDVISRAARAVSADPANMKGIILGGSGQGEAIVANRFPNVRAVVYYGPAGEQTDSDGEELDMLTSTRAHNDANVLSLAARFLSAEEAKRAVEMWLDTDFSGAERHKRRIKKIDEYPS